MSKFDRIISHPDKDEFISKLLIGIAPKEINEWLRAKYANPAEKQFVISEKQIKDFQDRYLDIYNMIQSDLVKTKSAPANSESLELSVQNNPSYHDAIVKMANQELDVRKMMAKLVYNIEANLAQIFDAIQEDPRNIDTKSRRLLNDTAETFGNLLDKYYKFTEVNPNPTLSVNHNISVQVIDQHISAFHDTIKDILSQLDLESSLLFMEIFNERMSKLKAPSDKPETTTEMKLAEVKLLNETINKNIQ